jgi:hypothetical protein
MGRSDLYEALSQDFSDRLCNHKLADDQSMVLSYFAMELPEMVNNRGLDCFFGRAGQKEDATLWYMMDAWRGSGNDRPESLTALAANAKDNRTLWRLLPPEQAAEARASAGQGQGQGQVNSLVGAVVNAPVTAPPQAAAGPSPSPN